MTRGLILFVGLITVMQSSQAIDIQTEDKDFLRKQEVIFQLLWNTKDTPKNHPEVFERVKNYKIEDVAAGCENQTFAKEFEAHLKRGMLPRGQVFSTFRDEHIEEVRTIFNVFHNAKNFDDFASMAAWCSLVVNELSWLHAFTIAIAHRPDTKYIRLPRLYEILPHYFFNTDIVMRAYRIKTGEVAGITNQYTIEANYTDQYPTEYEDAESKLSYFREDVGLNEFYFHFTSSFPFWMSSNELQIQKSTRGELYYQVHKMLLARYKLERLSMGLTGEIEDIDWDQPILTGFHPSMTHFNGLPFPQRFANFHVPVFKYKYLEEAKHLESRVSRAIDLGELRNAGDASTRMYDAKEPTNFNDFCNALEGNADSPNPKFYGSLDRIYRRLLGFAPESTNKHRYTPSALEMSLTSLRDPGFYRMCKRIVDYGIRFKRNLSPYSQDELRFEGVRIDYVHMDRLVTYPTPLESILNHPRVLQLDESISPIGAPRLSVKVRQFRLDHKPFTYEIGVSSEKVQGKAIVRIFLGPKLDARGNQIDLEDSLDDLYELDRWIVELKQGSIKLERSSADSVYVASESISSSELYNRQLGRALASDSSLAHELVSRARSRRGLPAHLLLPRGSKAGLVLRLVVCLHPIQPDPRQQLDPGSIFGTVPMDGRALGFPFDRPLDTTGSSGMARNFLVKDVRVYHDDARSDSEGNLS